jgi:hypothetical protein
MLERTAAFLEKYRKPGVPIVMGHVQRSMTYPSTVRNVSDRKWCM